MSFLSFCNVLKIKRTKPEKNNALGMSGFWSCLAFPLKSLTAPYSLLPQESDVLTVSAFYSKAPASALPPPSQTPASALAPCKPAQTCVYLVGGRLKWCSHCAFLKQYREPGHVSSRLIASLHEMGRERCLMCKCIGRKMTG